MMSVGRWAIPVALGLAVLVTIGYAVRDRPRRPETHPPVVPERIGLTATPDGDALRLEWNRTAPAVRTATHALLHIQDGKLQSDLNLNEGQLAASTVRYWPETRYVRFRLELHGGKVNAADEVAVTTNERPAQMEKRQTRAVVEKARPSPFERPRPEVVRKRKDRGLVATVAPKEPQPVAMPKESRLGKLVSRIPLLRRLKKQQQVPDPQPVADTESRR